MSEKGDNPAKNFALTGHLKAFPKDGPKPTLTDFNEAISTLTSTEVIEALGINCFVGQVEQGENGTMHLQGYVQLDKKTRRATFNKRVRKHTPFNFSLQNARGSAEENVAYCTKGTGPWTYSSGAEKINTTLSVRPIWINEGGLVKKGTRNDLKAAIRALENGESLRSIDQRFGTVGVRNGRGLADYQFRKKSAESKGERLGKVVVLHGKAGTGKSWKVRHDYAQQLGFTEEDVFSLNFEGNVWFDGYAGEKILLIDDFEPKAIKRSYLLRMVDIYPFMGQVKGGHVVAEWDYVFITSNHPYAELFQREVEVLNTSEDGEHEWVSKEWIPDDAMYSRIDANVCFDDLPDRRREIKQTIRASASDFSVSSLLPDTLEHGTNEVCAMGQSGVQGEHPPATNPPNDTSGTLEHFANDGTKQEGEPSA